MAELANVIWIEWRKAVRSGMLLWTGLAALVLPLGVTFLMFVSRNPQLALKLGLIGAKANLPAFASTDWPMYLGIYSQLVSVVGLMLFVLVLSWVFGREFVDGTLKDLLAVPVGRSTIVLAKYAVFAAWAAALSTLIVLAGMVLGGLLQLPGGSGAVLARGALLAAASTGLTILAALPFALAASVGRGYLLPMGLAILVLMVTNVAVLVGWGEYFPWAVAGLFAQGQSALGPASFVIVALTGLAGIGATYVWWQRADQNR